MQCLSFEQSVSWVNQRLAIGAAIEGWPYLREMGLETHRYALPEHSGRKVALAKWLYTFFETEEQILVLLGNWVVNPSAGHIPLVLRLRQALGDSRSLEECPGQLLSNDEYDDGISLLLLSAEFFLDCFVLGKSAKTALFISHDEYHEFYTGDPATLAEFQRVVPCFI